MNQLIKINKLDNVAVATGNVAAKSCIPVDGKMIIPKENIPAGHKVSLCSIAAGENIIKYGRPIGHAICDIEPGCHVHTHNIKTNLGDLLNYTYHYSASCAEKEAPAAFMGYRRSTGKVGIRNEIWIIPTVGCINSTVKTLEMRAQALLKPGIDGIYSFAHPYGCSQLGDDHVMTRTILAGLVNHPNAAAVLIMGLGCENNIISDFMKAVGKYDEQRVRFFNAQDVEDEIEYGMEQLKDLADYACGLKREPCDTSDLVVGLKCGGSDGFSGITANALVGRFSDMLIARGGSSILTEVPEMFGAETILMNHCRDRETFEKTVLLINDFKEYYIRYNQVIYENPSPGNKAGGISTLEEKSLGCTQKGGKSDVVGVLDYGEAVKDKGLNLLKSPGNDLIAATALAVSGAQIVLFTTGRGTPLGSPVPTVKLSTNNVLFEKKKNWIDFNAGRLLDGISMEELSEEFFQYILSVANGERTKAELSTSHDIGIFKDGVTL